MFIHGFQRRFSFTIGLFVLIPALSLVGGCGEEQQVGEPDTAQQPADPPEPHAHDDHAHDDHAHDDHPPAAEAEVAAVDGPVELDAESQAALDRIMTAYLGVSQRLADDEMEEVLTQLDELHDAAHALMRSDAPGVEARARAVAEPVHQIPADLEEARELFKSLSAAMVDLTSLAAPSDEAAPTLYRAHCPMVEGDWLQTEQELVNPYMGQDMLRCGTLEGTVKPAQVEEG